MRHQERIDYETTSAVVTEHVLRYRFAAPLVAESALWADLGSGNGIAAAQALDGPPAGRVVLVDVMPDAVESAREALAPADCTTLVADLASSEGIERMREELLAEGPPGPRTVTCFEAIEHLSTWVPLLEVLIELGSDRGFDVILSVPNDAFWATENPHHRTIWSGEAFDELRRLLPDEHLVAAQFPLQGSCVHVGDEPAAYPPVEVSADGVRSHFLVAFGPRVAELRGLAHVVQADLERQRAWERQRESDRAYFSEALGYCEERTKELELRLAELEGGDGGAVERGTQAP